MDDIRPGGLEKEEERMIMEHNEHDENMEEMKQELLDALMSNRGGGSVTWDEETDGYCVKGSGAAITCMAFACAEAVIKNRIGDPMAFLQTIGNMVLQEMMGQHDAEEGAVK